MGKETCRLSQPKHRWPFNKQITSADELGANWLSLHRIERRVKHAHQAITPLRAIIWSRTTTQALCSWMMSLESSWPFPSTGPSFYMCVGWFVDGGCVLGLSGSSKSLRLFEKPELQRGIQRLLVLSWTVNFVPSTAFFCLSAKVAFDGCQFAGFETFWLSIFWFLDSERNLY